ncbi:MAG: Tetratricopeptide domain protein [Promethearchaeota archaeon]|nr:MAG: Tetratricopeptide domain protein [Candidatus Lokiarchaeota archaeon]
MINNQDKEEIEIEALQLVDQAEELVAEGKGKKAIDLYEKAAQRYLDLGSYMKIDELFIRIASIISKFKNNIQAVYRLKSIIRKTQELNLEEISAKLLIQLGNIAYRMKDYETAAESWEQASDYFYDLDPEEYYNLSSELLLKAGEAYERTNHGRDKGEILILKSVMTVNKFDELYQNTEKEAIGLLKNGQFKAAADKFKEISQYFRKGIENLNQLIKETEYETIVKNSKARLLHLTAEYEAIAALCLRAPEIKEYNDEIKELGHDSIELFKKAIDLLKEYLKTKKIERDKEDVLRITFDVLLISIMQGMLGRKFIDPLDYLSLNIRNKKLLKKLTNSPYYKLADRIDRIGIKESLDKLAKTQLGKIDKIKEILIPIFK